MAAPAPKLRSPRYRVVIGDPEGDPGEWVVVEVQSIGRDMTSAETSFAKHKDWGKPTDAAVKFQAVSAYWALRRTGRIQGSWEDFEAGYIEVAEAGEDEATPTEPGPEPG